MNCSNEKNTVGFSLDDTNSPEYRELFSSINSWTDIARELSILNNMKNVVLSYVRDKREYSFTSGTTDVNMLKIVSEQYNKELGDATNITAITNIFLSYLDDIPNLADKESEITNYVNFLCKYYYGIDLRMDNFFEDGPALDEYIDRAGTMDKGLILDYIKDNFMISSVRILKGNVLCTTYRALERCLFISKIFGVLNKYTLHNYLKHGSYTFLRDKQAEVYSHLVDALASVGPVPVICKLYLNLKDFPKREFMLLVKENCIQVF